MTTVIAVQILVSRLLVWLFSRRQVATASAPAFAPLAVGATSGR